MPLSALADFDPVLPLNTPIESDNYWDSNTVTARGIEAVMHLANKSGKPLVSDGLYALGVRLK
jgi:hypothetical protein